MRAAPWLVAVAIAGACGPAPPDDAPAPFPYAVCGGAASHAVATVTGELRLHRALLPGGAASVEVVREAAALQLRYAATVAQSDAAARQVWTPDGPPFAVEVVRTEEVAYGSDLALDWPNDPALRAESGYVRGALERGRLAASDPALAVSWRARVGLAWCDADGAPPESLALPGPRDPYLHYWEVPAAQRTLHTYGKVQARSFPCADPEIAEYPHPEYLWYFWRPYTATSECAHIAGGLATVRLTEFRRRPPSGELAAWRAAALRELPDPEAPLRVVAVFGYLNHQSERPRPDDTRAQVLAPGPVSWVDATGPSEEWGTNQYVRFLRGLERQIDERTLSVHTDDAGGVTAAVEGRLRRSRRRVHIAAHLTETDFTAPAPYAPRHQPLLLAALREADVILYAGHSGLGANFSVAQLERGAAAGEVEAALAGSRARLLAFIGCYTYAYFGEDLARRLGRVRAAAEETLFVYTGNAVAETADSAAHVLGTLDCLLQPGGAAVGGCDVPPPGRDGAVDFLIYDHAR